MPRCRNSGVWKSVSAKNTSKFLPGFGELRNQTDFLFFCFSETRRLSRILACCIRPVDATRWRVNDSLTPTEITMATRVLNGVVRRCPVDYTPSTYERAITKTDLGSPDNDFITCLSIVAIIVDTGHLRGILFFFSRVNRTTRKCRPAKIFSRPVRCYISKDWATTYTFFR